LDGFARRWGARVAFKGRKEIVGNFAVVSLLDRGRRYFPSAHKAEVAFFQAFEYSGAG
jgi:hypothetical protein